MAVSSSKGRLWTVNELISRAYKQARLLEVSQDPTEDQYEFGRQSLEDILDQLPNEGQFCRVLDFDEVTLTEDTYKYTLAANTLDVLPDAQYITASETDTSKADGETRIRLVSQQEWHRLSSHGSKGRPTLFWPNRKADLIEAWLWPIPDEAGTVRFRVHRRLADANDGEANLDLEAYWVQYLKKALAADLASASSLDSAAASLGREAQMLLEKAKGKANPRPNAQLFVAHRGPWG